MNDAPNTAKLQVIEKLKSATNILVTVSTDPSIDQLAACIAMTLLLNKYKKNATAVFSGKVPPFLNYLKPKDNIEPTVDSLRDFIIAIDKSKADKLRYKVEDDVVKIFITPFRTSITEKDLKYSAGEFNVDVIVALGVQHQPDLDKAITAHGRIFHDAVVVCINNEPGGDFGIANWEDLEASSLSELIAHLIEELGHDLLDAPIATALLTGIVAETSRFSNNKTHPSTMNVSSTLLEAGADQLLVNTQLQDIIGTVVNLEAGTEIRPTVTTPQIDTDHTDVTDELVIDEHGAFTHSEAETQAAEPSGETVAEEVAEPLPEESLAEEPRAQVLIPPHTPEFEPAVPSEPAVEAMTNLLSDRESYQQPQPSMIEPESDSSSDGDAEAARQAVESALSAPELSQTEVEEPQPAAVLIVDPVVSPPLAAAPLIQPIMPDQSGYNIASQSNNVPTYGTLGGPTQEPAPLGMSPADQPFTMPMPPISSMPAPMLQPPIEAQPLVAGMPPPLPPPMMPPNFNGSGR